ncbi:hypothetical protein J6590_007460 [Homalodisca vitripennis]|nr:hypothetical protein J6590_007460 [Homalodisca vitripennis]
MSLRGNRLSDSDVQIKKKPLTDVHFGRMATKKYCRKIVVYDWAAQKTYLFRLGVWFYIERTRYLVELHMLPQPPQPPPVYSLLMDNFAWSFQEWNYTIGITHHHPRSFVSLTEKVAAFWAGFSSVALLLMLYYKYDGGKEYKKSI